MSDATVLVVHDDALQQRHLTRLLERRGYQVHGYDRALPALADLARGNRDVDLAIVDLHMPGIDGWRFCRLLRSQGFEEMGDLPILVVSTTFAGTDVDAVARGTGANAFLSVPFSPEQLYGHVDELLAGGRPRKTPVAVVVMKDEEARNAVSGAFRSSGYGVRTASSGREGLVAAETERPDVLVVDCELPDLSGDAFLAAARGLDGGATVAIAITEETNPLRAVDFMKAGAHAYVRKPFDPARLLELTSTVRRERSLLRIEGILEERTRELRRSEERYRALFDAIPAAVLLIDRETRILHGNPAAEAQLGSRLAGVLGTPLVEFIRPQDRSGFRRALAEIWVDGRGEVAASIHPDEERAVEVEIVGKTEVFRQQPCLLLVSRDVTERNRAEAERRLLEAQVRHAQKLESLGVLAGGIAHDFNNLLMGVLGNARLARADLEAGSRSWESLHQIEVAARRAAELTAQILSYSGQGDVEVQPIDLPGLLREMGELLEPAVSKKAVMRYELGEDLPAIQGDRSQLQQVVMNLVMNASDALEGRAGEISIRSGARQFESEELGVEYFPRDLESGLYCYLEVEDTGSGMSQEVLERIFDPFFTTKSQGRGLGMAATRGIVRAHGGAIRIRTAPGEGTTFRVIFPAAVEGGASPVPEEEPSPVELGERIGSGELILVVDDEVAVRELAKTVLEGAGYRVALARNGRAGLELYRKRSDEVEAALLDLTMPEMDGEEMLEAVRSEDASLPVVLSSGFVDESTARRLEKKGIDELLPKPYDPTDLLRIVSSLLPRRRRGRR